MFSPVSLVRSNVDVIYCRMMFRKMGSEGQRDPLKGVDWKAVGTELQKDPSAGAKAVVKKRLPKKIRQIPDYYFLPRRSWPSALAFYGSCILGGIGAGMLVEVWINQKVKEDGGVIWEFDK
ncbi:PREDICTED: uncharacterized protein LOC104825885 isoform X2 [Tarenaya hassleriana]|uniref:uncharacterized protein LOC104825885 isoform X2 n=1 Tax=Tarenaya hassleriana TaxID=28532 RepID=UPI00053C28EE|nr:PREDICTED: uncharacterized protein LOC104825885 isoform X2 [Tarenaya hassleriana]